MQAAGTEVPHTFAIQSADDMIICMWMEVEQNKVVCRIASRFLCVQLLLSLSDKTPSHHIHPTARPSVRHPWRSFD